MLPCVHTGYSSRSLLASFSSHSRRRHFKNLCSAAQLLHLTQRWRDNHRNRLAWKDLYEAPGRLHHRGLNTPEAFALGGPLNSRSAYYSACSWQSIVSLESRSSSEYCLGPEARSMMGMPDGAALWYLCHCLLTNWTSWCHRQAESFWVPPNDSFSPEAGLSIQKWWDCTYYRTF